MFQQLHGTGPASSTPDDSNGCDGDGREAPTPPTVPELGPGEAACLPRLEGRSLGLPPLPSFSSFARGQHQNLPSRPRIRRRDAKPSAQKQKSATKASFVQNPAHPSPLGPSSLQAQSPNTHTSERRQRKHPHPLRDPKAEELPTLSSPLIPSPSASAPSIAKSHKDIEQLANNFSRHRLELTAHHGDGRTIKHSTPTNASESSFGHFDYRMSDLCLRGGGNVPVSDLDLEVDMACDSQENTGSNAMQMPSQGVSASTHQLQSPSSCDVASHNDKPLASSRHLERMPNSRTALATASVRVPTSLPLPPHLPMLGGPSRPAESVAQQPPTPTPSMTVTPAPAAGALSLSSTSIPVTSPGFQPHQHSSSIAQPHNVLADLPRQESISIERRESANFPACLPLSPESLALPHHAPIHDDVPSSGYDMKSWLESSSTVEAPPSLATGAIGSNDMTGVFLTAMVQARASRRTGSNTHLQRSSPLKRVHTPQRLVPSYFDNGGPVGLANETNEANLPVADLEVDMIGTEAASYDSTDEIVPDTPEAIEAFQRELSPSGSSTNGALGSVLAAYLEHRSNRSGAEADGRHVPLSQRLHMAHMQAEREVMFRQAGFVADDDSVVGAPAANDYMDVDMREPTIMGLPSWGPSVMGGSWDECAPSLRPDSEQDGGRRYTGPLRYRLSSEVAMRCANLVHSRPRMRRRRQDTDNKAAIPTGSVSSTSAKDGSVGDGTEAESTQSNGKEQQHPSSTRDRRTKLGRRREMARQPSRNLLAQGQANIHARSEANAHDNVLLPGTKADCPSTGQLPLPPPALDISHQADAPIPHTMP
ncbi:hypothetical protein F503_05214 [Ophiostoma piceae UAMH 11346]|uniref:Uncharacterized protein n=1 Tax=Ophiostoma piceae (strain UAMH 11346) TaxID=1262450 RepID=S3C9E0_OPHP1|nr:hypothetical protein F503_05214 [Ophiostoma piceae UAMH 11346]